MRWLILLLALFALSPVFSEGTGWAVNVLEALEGFPEEEEIPIPVKDLRAWAKDSESNQRLFEKAEIKLTAYNQILAVLGTTLQTVEQRLNRSAEELETLSKDISGINISLDAGATYSRAGPGAYLGISITF